MQYACCKTLGDSKSDMPVECAKIELRKRLIQFDRTGLLLSDDSGDDSCPPKCGSMSSKEHTETTCCSKCSHVLKFRR